MRTVDRKKQYLMELVTMSTSVAALLVTSSSNAMTEKDYKNALKIAQEKVAKSRSSMSASALSSPIIKAYFGRYYKVGDSWDVASWELKNPLMGLNPISQNQEPKVSRGGVFHYEVKEVRNGTSPEVVISVRQISDFGMSPVDPQIVELTLTMSDRFVQTEKAYRVKGYPDPVKVSPDGVRTRVTQLELFALDVPEIATAIHNPPTVMPELPSVVQGVANRAGFKPNLSQSTWLEQEDFFGRPVEILWQYGNPWPAFLKTSTSISILLRSSPLGRTS